MQEFGLVGLGVMGKNLALNLINQGISLAVYNRNNPPNEINIAKNFADTIADCEGFDAADKFISAIKSPRKILLMVNAGTAIDEVISNFLPYLEPGDILIDGGNSHFLDTQRRQNQLLTEGIHFLGAGISGGEEGARNGASIMPGGNIDAYNIVASILEKIAATDFTGKACCKYVGPEGAGHFVKMVHNGMEYAEMQIIAETYFCMNKVMRLSLENISNTFNIWNDEGLKSYLLEISRNILLKKEGNDYLIDKILDSAAQKGTGGWSSQTALDLGIPLSTISEAVTARIISGMKIERKEAAGIYGINTEKVDNLVSFKELKSAYQCARIINHHIGFAMLSEASEQYKWNLNLSEIAQLWTNGCIIRSELMESLSKGLKSNDKLLLLPEMVEILKEGWKDVAHVVSIAHQFGIALPVFSASLDFFLAYTTADSCANMIQAQRDYFGAHTYKRIDKDLSQSFHTNWFE